MCQSFNVDLYEFTNMRTVLILLYKFFANSNSLKVLSKPSSQEQSYKIKGM